MKIRVHPADLSDITSMQNEYRSEANCQIVTDSILWRELADLFLIFLDGEVSGYSGAWNKHFVGRVMEFFTTPEARRHAQPMFRELLGAIEATHVEAQTNMHQMLTMLFDFTKDIIEEKILFQDSATTDLICPGGKLRPVEPGDRGPKGEWVIDLNGEIVAAGEILDNYNPPYGVIYMEVAEPARGKGYGAFIVQKLKRICRKPERPLQQGVTRTTSPLENPRKSGNDPLRPPPIRQGEGFTLEVMR